jgi:SAM-dependent methyltransferase
MQVARQVELRKLVCPKSRQPLRIDSTSALLLTADGAFQYPLLRNRVPILLEDLQQAQSYVQSSTRMVKEYGLEYQARQKSLPVKIKTCLMQDYRSSDSRRAFASLFDRGSTEPLYLSIGGGPGRPHPQLVNLNIGPFPNVDVVADALRLPYADQSVDAVYCEAVLEHLIDPCQAVREMQRVLVRGGRVFAATPFLQAYHGYPHHYQNFTISGHQQLFSAGHFRILESGVCVGPAYTLVSLTHTFLQEYLPFGKLLSKAWGLAGALLRPLDKYFNLRENAHVMASTTYLLAEKQ